MDWLHWTSVVLGLAQISLILWYYARPLQDLVDGGLDTKNEDVFISDFLFADAVYRSLMTFFVAAQLGVCAIYVTRLRDADKEGRCWFFIEIVLFFGAWIGWTILCAEYQTPDGKSSDVHFTGVGIFVTCSALYVILIIRLIRSVSSEWTETESNEYYCVLILFVVSIVLGTHFIVRALNEENDAWITEHVAFVTFVLTHMGLFILDSKRWAVQKNRILGSMSSPVTDEPIGDAVPVSDLVKVVNVSRVQSVTQSSFFSGIRIQLRPSFCSSGLPCQ
jgi:hypothetical protein